MDRAVPFLRILFWLELRSPMLTCNVVNAKIITS